MQRNDLETLMASALYGEISDEERRILDEWLNAHPGDRTEFEELQRTCALLDRLKTPEDARGTLVEFLPKNWDSWRRWSGWSLAAAACFAFLFVAGTQGFMIQVGSFRVGVGSPGQPPDVPALIRQELASSIQPTLDEIDKTVGEVQASYTLMARRQTGIEQSMVELSAVQDLNKRQMQKALTEFVDDLDRRLQPYLLAMNAPSYPALPASN
jgi:hypothetical protein